MDNQYKATNLLALELQRDIDWEVLRDLFLLSGEKQVEDLAEMKREYDEETEALKRDWLIHEDRNPSLEEEFFNTSE